MIEVVYGIKMEAVIILFLNCAFIKLHPRVYFVKDCA